MASKELSSLMATILMNQSEQQNTKDTDINSYEAMKRRLDTLESRRFLITLQIHLDTILRSIFNQNMTDYLQGIFKKNEANKNQISRKVKCQWSLGYLVSEFQGPLSNTINKPFLLS